MSIIHETQILNQRGQFLARTHAGFSKTTDEQLITTQCIEPRYLH
jgi:hypothetical protein